VSAIDLFHFEDVACAQRPTAAGRPVRAARRFPAYAHRTDVFFRDRANIAALHEDKMKALSEVVR
jgi:hypothetical protein